MDICEHSFNVDGSEQSFLLTIDLVSFGGDLGGEGEASVLFSDMLLQ